MAAALALPWAVRAEAHTPPPDGSASVFDFDVPDLDGPRALTTGPDGEIWFTETGPSHPTPNVARIDRFNQITRVPVSSQARDIAAGPDGNVWFTTATTVGQVTPAGTVTEFAAPKGPVSVTAGADGNAWFTEPNAIGRMTPGGSLTEFALPTATDTGGIVAGPDGNLWFTEAAKKIGRITTAGAITEFPVAATGVPLEIAAADDGAIWVTEPTITAGQATNRVGRLSTSGTFAEFATPTAGSRPTGIALGADGNFWVTEPGAGKIAEVEPDGTIEEYALQSAGDPTGIARTPDGLWFAEPTGNRLGRVYINLRSFSVDTVSGAPGSLFASKGYGCPGAGVVTTQFRDPNGRLVRSDSAQANPDGTWRVPSAVPPGSAPGLSLLSAQCSSASPSAFRDWTFIVPSGRVVPISPVRLLDTRDRGYPLGPGQYEWVGIPGSSGLPHTGIATALLNVTAVEPTEPTHLTVFPQEVEKPLASNLNVVPGQTHANLVEVPVGPWGAVYVYNNQGSVHLVVDILGYGVVPRDEGGLFHPQVAARIADSRTGSGYQWAGAKLGHAEERNVHVAGQGGVPANGAKAVALNVTVTNPSSFSFVSAYPSGAPRPNASNLNFVAGETVANRVVVPLSPSGDVTLYNNLGATDVIVDVGGWFDAGSDQATSSGGLFPVTPARIRDTRPGSGLPGSPQTLGAGGTSTFLAAGVAGVPAMEAETSPGAVVLNVTATNTTAASYFTVYPAGTQRPTASDLNWPAGATVPNLVIAKVAPDGNVTVYNNAGSADLVVDVVGWIRK